MSTVNEPPEAITETLRELDRARHAQTDAIPYEDGWYGTGTYQYTVFCKMPDDSRGYYSEEIDVRTNRRSVTAAKQAAQRAIDRDYDKRLRPSRVAFRPAGFMF